MKKIIISLTALFIILYSCSKDNCKEQQAIDLQKEFERFQREISNSNLTSEQIAVLTARHNERNKTIMEECR